MNVPTLILCCLILIAVVLAIRKLIHDRKSGRSSCGGDCSHCSMTHNCRKNQ